MKCKDCKAMCCSEIFVTEFSHDDDKGRIPKIAKHLGMSEDAFREKYMENASYVFKEMIEKENRKYCIFIDPETFKCTIYDVRPKACVDYTCGYYMGGGY